MKDQDFSESVVGHISMQQVRDSIASDGTISDATRRDYLAQIDRCINIYNVNGLGGISTDLLEFRSRFSRSIFPHEVFKTHKAYLAWRKKMNSILKRVLGFHSAESERRARDDGWAKIIDYFSGTTSDNKRRLISVSLLADEARKVGRSPSEMDRDWLVRLMDDLSVGRRRVIPAAIHSLNIARGQSALLDAIIGPNPLPDPTLVRRTPPDQIPTDLDQQIIALVVEHCAGEVDEISQEASGALAAATQDAHRAALRKYFRTALAIGALSHDAVDLSDGFDKKVFIQVVRKWNSETDRGHRISDRTKRSYIGNVMMIAAKLGRSVDFMKKAMDLNPSLKNGRAEAESMPLKTKQFCIRLLRHRDAEMIFRSLHLRFHEQAVALMSTSAPGAFNSNRVVQLAMLAVFSAIALWGVPLRIGNLLKLRHRGTDPTLVLPHGSRKRAYLLIPAQEVKNRKPIKAHISDGPTRALEILDWYLEEVRPRIPGSEDSDYLFPGYDREIISEQSLRDWLQHHSRALGLPMDPHNFRHGLATLYLRAHPGEYSQAARLLCNTPQVVRAHYAWIDEEAEMKTVQEEVARMGGLIHGR